MSVLNKAHKWIEVRPQGVYIAPIDFYIDPVRPVRRALITHGHADHARAGHGEVVATPQTLDIMALRYGKDFTQKQHPLAYGQSYIEKGVRLSIASAGHVLGSAQIIIEYDGIRLIAAGDYKRKYDPTVTPFEVVPCDIFITEATFGLPVFKQPDPRDEIEKLLRAKRLFPSRSCFIGAYALGKAQRVIKLLRNAGYNEPIYIHGALDKLCRYYQEEGIDLGELLPATTGKKGTTNQNLAGQIILGPPSALGSSWANRLADPLICFASGWMQVKARARQRGVEVPLILSDHADWDDLLDTINDIDPSEVWITHGNEEALLHALKQQGRVARALSLIGYEAEAEE